MREIKFRAWDSYEGEMIDADSFAFEEYAPLSHLIDNWTDKGHAIMQYTGLHDKNGKEIYEGDIIKYSDNVTIDGKKEHISQVEFKTDLGGYCFHMECIGYGTINAAQTKLYKIEVIGNIYKNPELIGE